MANDPARRGQSGQRGGRGRGGRPNPKTSNPRARDRGTTQGPGPGAWRAERPDDGRPRKQIPFAPEPPEDVTADLLDRETRAELRTLPPTLADDVARHLVMAGRLLDEDPDTAYQHAAKAQALASRVAVAREALGLAAYATGRWAQALSELRAARRMSGSDGNLPVMADCERGLGRPERALALAGSPEAARLDPAAKAEMRIVAAGARLDLGQPDAAVLTLQVPDLKARPPQPWTARLRYAYAEALLAAGREDEAREWFGRAAEVDPEGLTDAVERLEELEGTVYVDLLEDATEDSADGLDAVQPAQDADQVGDVGVEVLVAGDPLLVGEVGGVPLGRTLSDPGQGVVEVESVEARPTDQLDPEA